MQTVYVIQWHDGEFFHTGYDDNIRFYSKFKNAKKALEYVKGIPISKEWNPKLYKLDLDKVRELCEEVNLENNDGTV